MTPNPHEPGGFMRFLADLDLLDRIDRPIDVGAKQSVITIRQGDALVAVRDCHLDEMIATLQRARAGR